VRQHVAFDPYALLVALERNRVNYVVGAFARVVHGTGEVTRGLDIVPSSREENLRRLVQTLDELGRGDDSALAVGADPIAVDTPAGRVRVVPEQ